MSPDYGSNIRFRTVQKVRAAIRGRRRTGSAPLSSHSFLATAYPVPTTVSPAFTFLAPTVALFAEPYRTLTVAFVNYRSPTVSRLLGYALNQCDGITVGPRCVISILDPAYDVSSPLPLSRSPFLSSRLLFRPSLSSSLSDASDSLQSPCSLTLSNSEYSESLFRAPVRSRILRRLCLFAFPLSTLCAREFLCAQHSRNLPQFFLALPFAQALFFGLLTLRNFKKWMNLERLRQLFELSSIHFCHLCFRAHSGCLIYGFRNTDLITGLILFIVILKFQN